MKPILQFKKGYNGTMYAMYYDVDIGYYFVFESCQYRIGKTLRSIPESLASLKDVLRLKVCFYVLSICRLNFLIISF